MIKEDAEDKPIELEDIKLINDSDSTWGVNYVLVEIRGKEKLLSRKIYDDIINQLENKAHE